MRRRDFITFISGAATSPLFRPLAARTQEVVPVIGFMHTGSPGNCSPGNCPRSNYVMRMAAIFSQTLKEAGFTEGQNLKIEYRWADGHNDRLPALAADLVARHVAVILAAGGSDPARAAKAATTTIPIVFVSATDPIEAGLVASINRPGGNVTGASMIGSALEAKRLELLHGLVPKASTIAVIINPNYPASKTLTQAVQAAAADLDLKLILLSVDKESDLEPAFATLVQQGVDALLVAQDAFLVSRREKFATLTARYAIPAIYPSRDFVTAGGLVSYGPDFADGYQQAGIYVGKILKGAKPADLPVVQPIKFELVINLQTARTLGLQVPAKLLALADDVIE
jgi:putative tryptophan/tyrosine transport system substrate-binding protein